ncbi:hypothetical protein BST26_13175 [Mycolicibacterium insubricum]|uniref:Uncharacterized protein n=1 Tax=Mycolicibacterium insubricum TaxID=444597 RepID=A0A1X0DD05_9MYCO|nr:hypothetical protein BST26_13175 [Mycolicibacterium insubricum]
MRRRRHRRPPPRRAFRRRAQRPPRRRPARAANPDAAQRGCGCLSTVFDGGGCDCVASGRGGCACSAHDPVGTGVQSPPVVRGEAEATGNKTDGSHGWRYVIGRSTP